MLRKLFALVSGECCQDNPDSPANHEVLLPGYLYGMIIRERLETAMGDVRKAIVADLRKNAANVNFNDSTLVILSGCDKTLTRVGKLSKTGTSSRSS